MVDNQVMILGRLEKALIPLLLFESDLIILESDLMNILVYSRFLLPFENQEARASGESKRISSKWRILAFKCLLLINLFCKISTTSKRIELFSK